MSVCEDFPCCGHEFGCCPSYDETGSQTDMKCTCGVSLPIDNGSSLCDDCLNDEYDDYGVNTGKYAVFEDRYYDA